MKVINIVKNVFYKAQQPRIVGVSKRNVQIAEDIKPSIKNMLEEARTTIGNFAEQEDLKISFLKADKFESSTVMKVDRLLPVCVEEGFAYPTKPVGKIVIPENDKVNFLRNIYRKLDNFADKAYYESLKDANEPFFFTPYI